MVSDIRPHAQRRLDRGEKTHDRAVELGVVQIHQIAAETHQVGMQRIDPLRQTAQELIVALPVKLVNILKVHIHAVPAALPQQYLYVFQKGVLYGLISQNGVGYLAGKSSRLQQVCERYKVCRVMPAG